ncbi:MAG: aspartate 1-decarboxylase [Candidatus Omnitrophota bacterium]
MLLTFCRAKIAQAKVTEAELYYEGSITIDEALLEAVGISPGEKVEVLNINNGTRTETYAIAGKVKSGVICLNGPAARLGCVGDPLIILSYGLIEEKDIKKYKTKVVYCDENNRIKS